MLTRFVKSGAALRPQLRSINAVRFGSTELQHGHGHDDHGHHNNYQVVYERLWRNKATLDWLPKPEGSWQEANAKKQAYYNQILAGGFISLVLAYVYLRTVVVRSSGALTSPPYHLIGKEDFPGSKYEDATGGK